MTFFKGVSCSRATAPGRGKGWRYSDPGCSSSQGCGQGGWSCHQRGIAAATDPKVGWHWRGALDPLEGAESALFLVKTQSMG